MKRRAALGCGCATLLSLGSAALLAAAVAGIAWVRSAPEPEEISVARPVPAPQEPAPAPPMLGVVLPLDAVDVVLPLDARVVEIAVEMGTRVFRGDRIARFEVDGLSERLEGARAAAAATAALVGQAEIDLAEAQQQLRELEAARAAFSGSEIAAAGFAERRARSSLQEARARHARELALLAEIEQVSAGGEITAPIDGVVTTTPVSEGAALGAGATVAQIASGSLGIRFAIEPSELGSISAGDPLQITLPSSGAVLQGDVVRISPWIDSASGVVIAEGSLVIPGEVSTIVISGMIVEVLAGPHDGT